MRIHGLSASMSCLLLLAAACGGDDNAPECPDAGTTLTYNNFGNSFLTGYCASCHAATVTGAARQGAPADEVFDTLALVQARSKKIIHEVVVEKSMPYGSASRKPTDAERQQLGEWLACGGKE